MTPRPLTDERVQELKDWHDREWKYGSDRSHMPYHADSAALLAELQRSREVAAWLEQEPQFDGHRRYVAVVDVLTKLRASSERDKEEC